MRSPGGKTKRTKEGGANSQLCTNSPRLFWKAKAVSAGRALPYRGTGTSSGASRHLPRAQGRLGRAHRDAPLRQRREIDSLRHGEPLPSAPLTAPPEGEPRGPGTSSGASRHLPRARGRLEGGQAHGRPSGGMAFAALRAGTFSRRGCPAARSRCRGRGRSRRRPRYRACPGRYPRGCRRRDRGPGRRRGPGWR